MKNLHIKLKRIDGKQYGLYRSLKGEYKLAGMSLSFLHIQGDPYAPPSRLQFVAKLKDLGIPVEFWQNPADRIPLADFLLRRLQPLLEERSDHVGVGKGGEINILTPGPEILAQSAVYIRGDQLEVNLGLGLPGDGRRVMADEASRLLLQVLTDALTEALFWVEIDEKAVRNHLFHYARQEFLREQLIENNLIAFVENGSILPRESGDCSDPLLNAIPFTSPDSLEQSFEYKGDFIKGMAIKKGITVITGGGFHGKSTLLHALENGVYNHIPGDGREGVVCENSAVKVKTEDGRRVLGSDISDLIGQLPGGMSTKNFATTNASGSTSQAANLVESLELGAGLILIDEDVSAVNFLIRDARTRLLVGEEFEPISPLVDSLKSINKQFGSSFILVIGACGDYIPLADQVLVMREYKCFEETAKAREIFKGTEGPSKEISGSKYKIAQNIDWIGLKKSLVNKMNSGKRVKPRVRNFRLEMAALRADLAQIAGLVSQSQSVGLALGVISMIDLAEAGDDIKTVLLRFQDLMQRKSIHQFPADFDFSLARPIDIASALLRTYMAEKQIS